MGSVRHVADIRADDASTESQSDISLQAGTNKLASQKGKLMNIYEYLYINLKTTDCHL